MVRTLILPSIHPRLKPAKAKAVSDHAPRVVVVPGPGPLNNKIRLAQYRRKKAIKAVNPSASFPLEVCA